MTSVDVNMNLQVPVSFYSTSYGVGVIIEINIVKRIEIHFINHGVLKEIP